ncbi:MAG: ABC transporter ATP-binding protein [Gammaproteobacteria bacterium 28-57-27]|nr:MAG: ABC transporter ATP-binding protein [Gammaproteobacteria bacterium 28-57-27]
MPPVLHVDQLACQYTRDPVLEQISFTLQRGDIACLLGPSGCGKTTALRLIAGFETPSKGSIRINEQIVSQVGAVVPPEKRQVGMVFQDYALFPHLNIADNIAFGLHPLERKARAQRVQEMLETVGLAGRAHAFPHELSGGQQQRVALARALAPKPALLLLDEPFSNLDVELREKLAAEVREIIKHEDITALMVTHDQHEAFAMADWVGVMHQGRIQQWDTAYNVYHRPSNRFVADFVGMGAFLRGQVMSSRQVKIELGVLTGIIPTQCGAEQCDECWNGCTVSVLIRPDDVIHDDQSAMQAKIIKKTFRGAEFLYTLELGSGAQILSLVPSHHDHAIGETIGIALAVDHVVAYPEHGE